MACCFTGSQICRSNSSFKSLKQQTSTISKSISNNYSNSQSQVKHSVSTNALVLRILHWWPEIMLWKHHEMGYCCHVFRDPCFLCAQRGINSGICHLLFGGVSFLLWLLKWLEEAVWAEWAKGLPAAWQKAACSFLQEFVSYRFD